MICLIFKILAFIAFVESHSEGKTRVSIETVQCGSGVPHALLRIGEQSFGFYPNSTIRTLLTPIVSKKIRPILPFVDMLLSAVYPFGVNGVVRSPDPQDWVNSTSCRFKEYHHKYGITYIDESQLEMLKREIAASHGNYAMLSTNCFWFAHKVAKVAHGYADFQDRNMVCVFIYLLAVLVRGPILAFFLKISKHLSGKLFLLWIMTTLVRLYYNGN